MIDRKTKEKKNPKASILIATIIILSVVMVTVLSSMLVSNIAGSTAGNSNYSLVAYQMADTGIENTLDAIVKGYSITPPAPPYYVAGKPILSNSWVDVGTCNTSGSDSGLITNEVTIVDGNKAKYVVQLYKRAADNTITYPIACNSSMPGDTFDKIAGIKVTGMVEGKSSRSVSASVPLPAVLQK